MFPASSVAREQSRYVPGSGLFQLYPQERQAHSDASTPSSASCHLLPPSMLNSTLPIDPRPDHARPSIWQGSASTKRSRDMKSDTPGGTINERGNMRVTGTPTSVSLSSR